MRRVILLSPKLGSDVSERLRRLSPPAPPCFGGDAGEGADDAWHQYLVWCEASGEPDMAPTVSNAAEPGAVVKRRLFNKELPFCRDCAKGYRGRMSQQGKCRPDWLRAREWDTADVPLLAEAGVA